MDEANDILQKTYDILEARGWCQGVHAEPDGRVCLEGAFHAAVSGHPSANDRAYGDREQIEAQAEAAWTRLVNACREETGVEVPFVFNDLPSTTVEDVKLLLKRAMNA